MKTSLDDKVFALLAKWKVPPTTARVVDKFRGESAWSVELALDRLRAAGRVACTNGKWHLLNAGLQFGRTDQIRKRKPKKPKPGSAVARTVSLFGDEP